METDLHTQAFFLSPSSLGQAFAEKLARQIIEGRFKPGERLIETKLAEQFGISRSPVREGLRILANESLVILVERRGAMVKPVTAQDIEETFSCRMVLQGLAARLAAERWQEPALAIMSHLIERMDQARLSGSIEDYFSANVDFHNSIAELCSNARLKGLLDALGKETLRLRFLTSSLEGRLDQSLYLHRQLLEAFKTRDGEQAERVTRELIWSGCQALVQSLQSDQLAPFDTSKNTLAADRQLDQAPTQYAP